MHVQQHKASRWFIALAASAAMLGCSDPIGERSTQPLKELKPRNLYSSVDGSNITVTDETDYETYTLNTSAETITRNSDSWILDLDSEQAAAAATAFAGAVSADAVMNSFDTMCSPEHPCGEPMSVTPGVLRDPDVSSVPSQLVITKLSESAPYKTTGNGRFGIHLKSKLPAKPFKSSKHTITTMSGDTCNDILQSVLQGKIEYKTSRVDFAKTGFQSAFWVVVGLATRGTLPIGGVAAARFMTSIATAQDKKIAVSVLGWMWNSYNCQNSPVNFGPVIRMPQGGNAGNANNLQCHDETWGISFDGGATYNNITISVCEYSAT